MMTSYIDMQFNLRQCKKFTKYVWVEVGILSRTLKIGVRLRIGVRLVCLFIFLLHKNCKCERPLKKIKIKLKTIKVSGKRIFKIHHLYRCASLLNHSGFSLVPWKGFDFFLHDVSWVFLRVKYWGLSSLYFGRDRLGY